jgi:predicted transcriptional regulator
MILRMSKQQPISVPLAAKTIAEVDDLAARLNCTREALIETAVHYFFGEQDRRPAYARLGFASEAELDQYLKPALDDVAAGRIHSREFVDELFDEMIARQRARAA